MTGILKRQTLPLVLSLAGILAILYTFTNGVIVFLLPVWVACAAVLRFCETVRAKKAWFFYLLAAAAVLLTAMLLTGGQMESFYHWITGQRLNSGRIAYFAALLALCVFFYPSAVFYFTNVVYRAPVLMLLVFIPSLLCSRKLSVPPPIAAAFLITLYFLIMMGYHANRGRLTAGLARPLLLFAVPLFVLSFALALIPPYEPLSRYNVNNPNNPNNPQNTGVSWELLGYNSMSSPSGGGTGSNTILFLVQADEPLYFMRQVFGAYDGRRWRQLADEPYSQGYYDWESRAAKMSFDALLTAVRDLAEQDGDFAARYADGLPFVMERSRHAVVVPQQNVTTRYLLAPMRTFRVRGVPSGISYIRSMADEYFITGSDRMPAQTSYVLSYYADAFRLYPEVQRWAESFDEEAIRDLAWYLADSGVLPDDAALYFALEWENAYRFPEYVGEYESAELTALAEQIVKGASGDYEKAVALERYFQDFTYSLTYAPPTDREDIEYFLLESRTGACGQFATAMTLMARASGLNARYVEGFLAQETNADGQYVIRGTSSHAFTQVFIAPYGWVTFEPTPGRFDTGNLAADILSVLAEYQVLGFFAALTAASALGLLVILMYKKLIAEALFRRRALRRGANDAARLLLTKMSRLAADRLGLQTQTARSLAGAVKARYGVDLDHAADCCERAAYNDETLSDDEKRSVFETYLRLYHTARKRRR